MPVFKSPFLSSWLRREEKWLLEDLGPDGDLRAAPEPKILQCIAGSYLSQEKTINKIPCLSK